MSDQYRKLAADFQQEFGLDDDSMRSFLRGAGSIAKREFEAGKSRYQPADRVARVMQTKLNSRQSQREVDAQPGPIGRNVESALEAAGDLTSGEEILRYGMAVGSGSMRPLTDPSFRLKVDGDQQSDSTLWSGVERAAALAYPDAIEDSRQMSPARSVTGFAERVAQAAPMAGQIMAVGGPVGGVMKAGAAKLGLTSLAQGTTRAAMAARVGGGAAQGAGTMTAIGAMNRAGTEQDVLDPGAITADAAAGAIFGVVGQVADEVGAAVLRNSKKYQEAARKVGAETAAGMGAKQLEAIKQAAAKRALDELMDRNLLGYVGQRIAMGAPGFAAEFGAGVAVDMAQGLPFDEAVVQGLAFAGADFAEALRRSRMQMNAPTMTGATRADIQARQQQAATDSRARGTARIQERVDAARAEDSVTGVAAPSDAPTMNEPTRGVTEGVAASEAEAIPRPEALPNEEGMQEGRQERRREEGVLNPSDSTLIPSVREEVRADEAAPPVDMVRGTQDDTTTIDDRPLAGSGGEDARAPEGDRPGEVSPSGKRPPAPAVVDAGGAVRADVEADPQRPVDRDTPPPLTVDNIAALKGKALAAALEERGLAKGGNVQQKRGRLERYEEGRANAEPTVMDDVGQGVRVTPGAPMRTRSGRLTAAVPEDMSTKATGTPMDAWLHAEAAKEAAGSDYLSTLVKGMDPKRLSPSDRDMLSDILFGRDVDTSERDPMMRRLRPLSEPKTSPAADTTPQGGDPATPTVGEEGTPTPAGNSRPASEAEAAGGDVPNERLPFTTENLKSAMNLTDEQAEATMAVAEAMGLDPEQITLARGQEPGLHALPQAAWHGTPHRFDKFSTEKIGTGEGAQAYGWGLYFAGDKEVAKWYKEKLSRATKLEVSQEYKHNPALRAEVPDSVREAIDSAFPTLPDGHSLLAEIPMGTDLSKSGNYEINQYAQRIGLDHLVNERGLSNHYAGQSRSYGSDSDSNLWHAGYAIRWAPTQDGSGVVRIFKIPDEARNDSPYDYTSPAGQIQEFADLIGEYEEYLAEFGDVDRTAWSFIVHNYGDDGSRPDAFADSDLYLERLDALDTDTVYKAVEELVHKYGTKSGALYKVDLDIDDAVLLDHDSPIGENDEVVQRAFREIAPDLEERWATNDPGSWTRVGPRLPYSEVTAGTLYRIVSTDRGIVPEGERGDKWLSLELKKRGIEGIKFLDGNSRRRGGGSHNYVIFDDSRVRIDEVLYQKNGETRKAAVDFDNEGRAVIYALEKPDASSGVHELAHVARRTLLNRDVTADERVGISDQDIRVVERWAGASKDGKWDTKAEEKFARGFEKYLRDGKAPKGAPAKLVKVFAKFKQWLTDIYSKVKGSPVDIRISNPMREVFDKLVTRDQAMKADARRKKRLATEARKKAEAEKGRAITTGVAGKETKADRPAAIGKDEPYRYEVVDINDAIPSHRWSGEQIVKNPDFPEDIQGRDLTAKAARLDIEQKVKNFAPSKMIADGEQGEVGSSIIGDTDNYLDAGRQRWLVLDRVREKKPGQYRAYVEELKKRSDQHGISADEIDRMVAAGEHPMLVRRRLFALDPKERRQYAQDLDTPRVGERSVSDQAAADADVLTPDLFSMLGMGKAKTFETALAHKGNLDFVSEFIRRLPRTMRARFTDGEGHLSADGVARIKAALMYKALRGESGRRLVDMATRFDRTGANLIRGIEIATPRLALLESMIADGDADSGLRISDSLAHAIEIAMDPEQLARLDGGDDMFADGGRMVPHDVEFMAKFLADNRKTPTKIGEFLSTYADMAIGGKSNRVDAVQAAITAVGDQLDMLDGMGTLESNPKGEGRIEPHKMPEIGERPLASNVEIVKEIRAIASDIPFFNAKPKSGARGEFDARKRTAKIGRKDDVSATVHEVGHSIDDGLKITKDLPKDIDAEVRELARPQLDKEVDEGKRPSPRVQAEAFAEWFRAMLVNPEQAEALYPRAHEVFMERMLATESGRKTLEKLGSVSEKVLDTLAASPRAQLTAQLALNLQSAESDAKAFADRAIENYKLLVNHPGDWKKQYGTGLAALGRKVQHWFMYNLVDDAYKFQRIYDELVQRARLGDGALKPTDDAMLLYRLWKGEGGKIRRQIESGFFNVFRPMVKGEWNKIEGTSVFKDLWKPIIEAAGEGGERLESVVRAFHSIGQAGRLAGLRDATRTRIDTLIERGQALIELRRKEAEEGGYEYDVPDLLESDLLPEGLMDDLAMAGERAPVADTPEIRGWKFLRDADKQEMDTLARLIENGVTADEQAKIIQKLEAEREAFLDRLVRVDMGLQGDGEPRGLWRDAEAVIEEERALLSDSEAAAIDKALETYRKISQVAILDPLLEAGIITQSQYDYYGEHQGFYFGFQRDLDTLEVDDVVMADDWGSDAQGPQRNELAQAGKVIHQLRGSSLSFENQLLSLTVQIERAQRAAQANRVKRATAHLLEYNPDGEVRQFQDDYKPASAVAFVSDEPLVRNGMQPIAFRDNGKQRYLVIGDKDFASVFRDTRGDIAQSIEGNPFFKALAWFARFKRSSITTTPWFVIRQLIRDPLSTSILSRNGTTARQVWGALLKSWTKGLDLTAEMEKFELGGGAAFGYERMGKQGYGELFNKMAAQAYDESGGKFILHHPRIAAKTGWNWWRRHIVEPSEYVSRVVEVENALKNSKADPRREHWSDYDHYLYAVGEGRDIMDFAVAGHHLRNLNRYVPFTTAQMRGLARAAQGAKEDPRGFAERIAKVSILPAIAYTAYLQSLPEDAREEYEQMPARLRDLSFPIYTGWLEDTTGIRWLMIPKPYELGLPGSLVQRMISASMGEDGAFGGFDETLAETMLPFNLSDIVFGGAVPVVEWMTNRSLWNDRPIVPPWDEGKDVRLRDTGSASVLGQMIEAGSFYKLDARKADFLVRESLGGWAQAAMGLSDLLRADRGEWTWGLGLGRFGSATGLVRSTTAGYGRDVVAVYDLATKLDLASAAPVTGLRRQLERFHNAQTPAERRSRAETVRQRAKSVLAWLRKQEGRTDRRAARVKSQQRKETFGE